MTDTRNTPTDGDHAARLVESASTSAVSRNAGDGVHHARLVESPVETSAPDRRYDFVPAPKPRAIVLRPTTHTQFVVTSAIDLRDDVVRDEVPGIVGDACHGILGAERDAIVQAIEQDDTRPIRRMATGTTPPSMQTALLRSAAERADVAAVRSALDHAECTSVESSLPEGSPQSEERTRRPLESLRDKHHDSRSRVLASIDRDASRKSFVSSPPSVASSLLPILADDDASAGATAADDALTMAIAAALDQVERASSESSLPEGSSQNASRKSFVSSPPSVASSLLPILADDDANDANDASDGATAADDDDRAFATDDALTMALARGSSPSLDRSVAIARGSSPSLEREIKRGGS